MRELSKTIMEINELHKLVLNFRELERNREWTRRDANALESDSWRARSSRPPWLASRRPHPCIFHSCRSVARDAPRSDLDGRAPQASRDVKLSETIVEINDLRKPVRKYGELERNREPCEIRERVIGFAWFAYFSVNSGFHW